MAGLRAENERALSTCKGGGEHVRGVGWGVRVGGGGPDALSPPFDTEPCLTPNLGFQSPKSGPQGADGAATLARSREGPEKGQGVIKVQVKSNYRAAPLLETGSPPPIR